MIDRDGYRPNVGIIICNKRNEVFWGKRVREYAWQFPQGGIQEGESPKEAMYRELDEEVGLEPHHVKIIGRTDGGYVTMCLGSSCAAILVRLIRDKSKYGFYYV